MIDEALWLLSICHSAICLSGISKVICSLWWYYLWKIAIVLQQKLLSNVFGDTSSKGQAHKTTTFLRTVIFPLSVN